MTAASVRRRVAVVVAAGLLAALAPACSLIDPRPDGPVISAVFARGTGLYPGSPVRILGIDVGRITAVDNEGGSVRVRMQLDEGAAVPADATATIVPLTLLGERYVQLGPVHTDGPVLGDGDEIPLERTSVPAEIDELLRGLEDFVGAIDVDQASSVVTNLAVLLEGQGRSINDLVANATDTLDFLAGEGDDLRAIVDSLGELTETLRGRTDSIERLVRDYDLVAQVLVDNRGDLDATIVELERATTELAALLVRHQATLGEDVEVLAGTTATVDANMANVVDTLDSAVKLFAAAERAYDARTNSLALNNQLAPELTSDIIAGRFRDRIAGICRRLEIVICSDPASPLLNDLVGLLPGLLGSLADGSPLQSAPVEPTTPAPAPPPPPPVPPAPTPPDEDELLALLVDQLDDPLDLEQLDLLGTLDLERILALLGTDPLLVQVLALLDADQVDLVRTVELDRLDDTLLALTNELVPPAQRLEPSLPRPDAAPAPGGPPDTTAPRPGGGGLLEQVTEGLGGLLAGSDR